MKSMFRAAIRSLPRCAGQGALPACRFARRRRGAIYSAELVLVMPVLMVLMLAVVQFGIFFTNLQLLGFASRVGAEAASETPLPASGNVPLSVLNAVEQHLQSNGINQCTVVVEHSGGQLETGACTCTPTTFNTPVGSYVRVTVCVPQQDLMPNLLPMFGYDISPTSVVSCATVMHQEM